MVDELEGLAQLVFTNEYVNEVNRADVLIIVNVFAVVINYPPIWPTLKLWWYWWFSLSPLFFFFCFTTSRSDFAPGHA